MKEILANHTIKELRDSSMLNQETDDLKRFFEEPAEPVEESEIESDNDEDEHLTDEYLRYVTHY